MGPEALISEWNIYLLFVGNENYQSKEQSSPIFFHGVLKYGLNSALHEPTFQMYWFCCAHREVHTQFSRDASPQVSNTSTTAVFHPVTLYASCSRFILVKICRFSKVSSFLGCQLCILEVLIWKLTFSNTLFKPFESHLGILMRTRT